MTVPPGSKRNDIAYASKFWRSANQPPDGEPWVWLSREMISSPAWAGMSLIARAIVDRIIIEHMAHAGTMNGELIVTTDDFAGFGVRRGSVAAAIREAEALGWISTTYRGRGGNSLFRRASQYSLEWLPRNDGSLPSNGWRRFKTSNQVNIAAKLARETKTAGRRAA